MRLKRSAAPPTAAPTAGPLDASVGIFINKHTSLFQNGCVQQSAFLYKLFLGAFREVSLVTVENDLSRFDAPFDAVPVRKLTDGLLSEDGTRPRYDVIVFVSGVLMDPPWLKAMRRVGTACVRLVCGNMFWLNQEEYVFGVHGVTGQNLMGDIREQWVLPMYEWSASYMKLLSGTDVQVTPYVWDPDIVEYVCRKDGLSLRPAPASDDSVVIVIMEPNLSVHKTSLVPMLIANQFHKAHPGRVHMVHHFCADDLVKRSSVLLSAVALQREGRVTHYPRMSFPHVMHAVLSDRRRVVVLSHVNQNDLNFLHLECMHFGLPVVHNCPPFAENGLGYATEDLAVAVQRVHEAAGVYDSAATMAAYRARCRPILERYSSRNRANAATYAEHVARLNRSSLADRHEFFRMRARFFEMSDDVFENRRYARGRGRGIVMSADGVELVSQALLALTALRRVGCSLPVEIVSAPGAMSDRHREVLTDRARFGDVRVIDVGEALPYVKDDALRGFQIKPLSVLASAFDEIVFMDCDVIPCVDPATLFDATAYRRTGCLFWRDFWQYGVHDNPYSAGTMAMSIAMGGARLSPGDLEIDSGMFLVDKARHARALSYAASMARMHEYFYKAMYGDKESFRIAFGLAGADAYVHAKMPGIVGSRHAPPPPAGKGITGWGMVQWSPDAPEGAHVINHVHLTIRKFTQEDREHAMDTVMILTDADKVGMGFVRVPGAAASVPMLWKASDADPQLADAPPELQAHVRAWADVVRDVLTAPVVR